VSPTTAVYAIITDHGNGVNLKGGGKYLMSGVLVVTWASNWQVIETEKIIRVMPQFHARCPFGESATPKRSAIVAAIRRLKGRPCGIRSGNQPARLAAKDIAKK